MDWKELITWIVIVMFLMFLGAFAGGGGSSYDEPNYMSRGRVR